MSLFETIELDDATGGKAAIRYSPSPGGSLLVWPAEFEHRPEIREALYRATIERGQRLGCKIAQVLLPEELADHAKPLESTGFHRLTSIVQMRCDFAEFGRPFEVDASHPVVGVEWLDCTMTNHDLLAKVLFETYPGSLDLPEIHDWRPADEVLAGHLAQGTPGLHDWSILTFEGEPAGVLLLANNRVTAELEIAYLGLRPQFRNRGLGDQLLSRIRARRGESPPWKWNGDAIVVNLDSRNAPALNLYQRWGLKAIAEHSLYIARMTGS